MVLRTSILMLMLSHVASEKVHAQSLLQSSKSRANCKTYCAKKVEKAATCSGETCTWDILCGWDDCATCDECPTTTTTTTTTEYTPYCKGVSLAQKTSQELKQDFARKVERENHALLMHHSYCGKQGEPRNVAWTQSEADEEASTDRGKGDCELFTSTVSPDGLETCDGDKDMPYPYAYHLHPTYDGDSRDAAAALWDAFAANFNVSECEHVDEQTVYSTKEKLCFLKTVKNACSKDVPTSWDDFDAIFALCQYGIYVRGGAMFDDSLGADGTSPWQWWTLNKDCAGASIDVLVHAVMCPHLAHGKWAFFVNGTHATDAGYWITGNNSVDGCYGQECNPDECETSDEVNDGTAYYEASCCAATAIPSVPLSLDESMSKTYSNVLKFQTKKAWWDVDTESVKNYGTYEAQFPATVWPGGTCTGQCDDLS